MTRGFPRHQFVRRLGTLCSVCKEPQYDTPGGASCKNGHGGADPLLKSDGEPVLALAEAPRPLSFKQVVALTLKLHAASMLLGNASQEAENVRQQIGRHPEGLTAPQRAELQTLNSWLNGFAERIDLL